MTQEESSIRRPEARVTVHVVDASTYRRNARKQTRRDRHSMRFAWHTTAQPRSFGKVW